MNNNFEGFAQKYSNLYEDIKKRKREIKIISNFLFAICILIFSIAAYKNDFHPNVIYIFGLVVLVIYFIRGRMINQVESEYKQTVIPELLGCLNYNLTYNAEDGHTEEEFIKSEQYNDTIDKYYSSDLMEGSIGKTSMKISYVVISQKQKSEKIPIYLPVFAGTFVTFDFNKYFSGKTKIYTNDLFAKLENTFDFFNNQYEKITLENQDFNDAFIVYTTDVQQAFYILSPELIENIIKLKSFDNNPRDINISFIDNKMYIVFEKEKFLDMDKTENCKQQIEMFYNEIKYMINIVEILELNNRIWTKQ